MHMLHIGRSTISICGGHQDQGGVNLLGPHLSQGKEPHTCMPYMITRLRNTMAANAWFKKDRRASNKERERGIRTIT